MQTSFLKRFHKQLNKLSKKEQDKIQKAVNQLVSTYPNTPNNLRLHALTGKWEGIFSISAGGDLRVHFYIEENLFIFQSVGSHAQLYG